MSTYSLTAPAGKAELRVRLQARELLHEHLAMYQELIREYRINLSREIGYSPGRPNVPRRRMVRFTDMIPSLRIAVDLKVELFRNAAKPWTMNAIPRHRRAQYGRPVLPVVVPDCEMASLLSRSRAAERYGTKIIAALSALPDALPDLADQARTAPGRPDRMGLGRAMGRLLPRLVRPAQERPRPAARRLTITIAGRGRC